MNFGGSNERRKKEKNKKQQKDQLYVLVQIKDLANYIFQISESSSKKYRYTIVAKLQNYILTSIECVYIANKMFDINLRFNKQNEAKRYLRLLGYISELEVV